MTTKNLTIWQKKAQQELKDKPLSSLNKQSLENIEVKPLYTSHDIKVVDEGLPGCYPFTRGIKATMYTNRPWTIRQYAGFSSASESNKFYRECLSKGQKGLSVAFDLPTHRGYDSDHPLVVGDVGKAGVAISSVEDMKKLFLDIDLGSTSVSMTMNGAVLPVLASFLVCAQESGVSKDNISGTIQNDILKEFMVRNTYIYPPAPSMRIVADIMEYCSNYLPKFNSISISGYHIHEAGADLALELGLTLADGIEYVQCAKERGLKLDNFAPRLSFFFATGMNFFLEIAKLRAARTIWAEVMRDFGCKDERSLLLRTHCQTSGWSLSAKDPYNNIVRTTIEAMASVLGGTQSLHTNSFDEALALPTETSARIARNTQLIIQNETKLTDVVDPLGGSYYVEALTKDIADKAKEIIAQIKQAGGMTKAILKGIPMRLIEESSLKRQAMIDSGQEVVVGVNKFISNKDDEVALLKIDRQKVIDEQKESLASVKASRDNKKVRQALNNLEQGARSNKNLLELSIEAMSARATVGEVSLALENVFGRYEPKLSVSRGVYRAVYSQEKNIKPLVDRVAKLSQKIGRQPRMLVAKIGQDGHDRGAKVVASAFSDLGFDIDISPLFETPKSIAMQAIDNDVHIIGVSSLAAAHDAIIPELMGELKKRGGEHILVVIGGVIPPDEYEELYQAGVVEIFAPGTSVLDVAERLIKTLEQRVVL